jgi:D-aminoacylase, C-terminal region.
MPPLKNRINTRPVKHVFVNGVQVIKNGEHTGAKPGRALWGTGQGKVAERRKSDQ